MFGTPLTCLSFACFRFMPSFLRLGSWNIVMFVTYEQIKRGMTRAQQYWESPFWPHCLSDNSLNDHNDAVVDRSWREVVALWLSEWMQTLRALLQYQKECIKKYFMHCNSEDLHQKKKAYSGVKDGFKRVIPKGHVFRSYLYLIY